MEVSESWLQNYVNEKYQKTPGQVEVVKKPKGPLVIQCDELWSFVGSPPVYRQCAVCYAVHDCWLPYFNFGDARHVLCGAHLLRELAAREENGSLWAYEMREFLLDLYQMPPPLLAHEQVHQHYHIILGLKNRHPNPVSGESLNNPPGATCLLFAHRPVLLA